MKREWNHLQVAFIHFFFKARFQGVGWGNNWGLFSFLHLNAPVKSIPLKNVNVIMCDIHITFKQF